MRFIIITIFLWFPLLATAQKNNKKNKEDQFPAEPLRFSGIRIGTDMLLPLVPVFSKPENQRQAYEICSEILLSNRLFIPIDFGYAAIARKHVAYRSIVIDNQLVNRVPAQYYFYENQGTYWRIGLDYNFMHRKTNDEALFVGGRIARSSFNHRLSYTYYDKMWENFGETTPYFSQTAWFGEGVAGLKVKVFNQLFVSTLLRVKFRFINPSADQISVNDIPGFGANNDAINLFVGWQLLYRIKW